MVLSIGKTGFFLFKCTSLTFTQQEKYEQHQQRLMLLFAKVHFLLTFTTSGLLFC